MTAIGAQLATGGATVDQLLAAARAYEDAGIESIWIGDHLIDHYDPLRRVPECFTIITRLAAATSQVMLGSLAASCIARPPGLLAQMAGTLAEVSDGRFMLGIGAGGTKAEYLALGIPWPRRAERIRLFERALRVTTSLRDGGPISDDESGLDGAYCRPDLGKTAVVAAALGPRTAAIAGTLADEVNVIDYAEKDATSLIDRAREAANGAGREITVSILIPAKSETEILGGRRAGAGLERAAELGAHRVIWRLLPPFPDPGDVFDGRA